MSDDHPTVVAAREVACPTCGAQPGEMCMTMAPWRKPSRSVHQIRVLERAATAVSEIQEPEA